MGAVYEAEQDFPHRAVALKVIRPGYANDEMIRRFENEAEALGRLRHPGGRASLRGGERRGSFGRLPYIAMELVQGLSLVEVPASSGGCRYASGSS